MDTNNQKNLAKGSPMVKLKEELKNKLLDLIQHPGTPAADKDKLLNVVNKLVK